MLYTIINSIDVSSLIFKLCAWKRGCKLPFKLQMSETSATLFWKALTKFYQGEKNLKPYNHPYNIHDPLNISTISTFKVL